MNVFYLLAFFVPIAQDGKKISNEQEDKIEQLIDVLGCDEAEKRDKAQEDLVKIGLDALDYLKKALESSDAEVRSRALVIIEQIEWGRGIANLEKRAEDLTKEWKNKKDNIKHRQEAVFKVDEIGKEDLKSFFTGYRFFSIADQNSSMYSTRGFTVSEIYALKRGDSKPLALTNESTFEKLCIESKIRLEKEEQAESFLRACESYLFNKYYNPKMIMMKAFFDPKGLKKTDKGYEYSGRGIEYKIELDKENKVTKIKRTSSSKKNDYYYKFKGGVE